MANDLFQDFDFRLLDSPGFKEDSVREEIIQPILNELGYSASGVNRIVRSQVLYDPYYYVGSSKRPVQLVPDYLLKVEDKCVWVLDAKSPKEQIDSIKNLEQARSYANHREIRVQWFALCNGKEFAVFSTDWNQPVLRFRISEYKHFRAQLHWRLSPQAFAESKPKNPSNKPEAHPETPPEPNLIVEKRVGILWSNLANEPVNWEIMQFEGQLLAEARKEDGNGPTFYELYRLPNGRYVVYIEHVHRFDYCIANLAGGNLWGEYDPPLTTERLQDEFSFLASLAGFARIRKLNLH